MILNLCILLYPMSFILNTTLFMMYAVAMQGKRDWSNFDGMGVCADLRLGAGPMPVM